jgi:hypothetical protein
VDQSGDHRPAGAVGQCAEHPVELGVATGLVRILRHTTEYAYSGEDVKGPAGSRQDSTALPALDHEVRVSRQRFERAAEPVLRRTIEATLTAIRLVADGWLLTPVVSMVVVILLVVQISWDRTADARKTVFPAETQLRQTILAAFATAPGRMRARDLCLALGLDITPKYTEGTHAKLKRLVARSILAEPEPGLFTLAPTPSA